MKVQMLATPLYGVSKELANVGPVKVIGFDENGDALCVQLGEITGTSPNRPKLWDQEKYGRLWFYDSMAEAHEGRDKAVGRARRRDREFVGSVESFVAEQAR